MWDSRDIEEVIKCKTMKYSNAGGAEKNIQTHLGQQRMSPSAAGVQEKKDKVIDMCKKCWAIIKKLRTEGDNVMYAYFKDEDAGKIPKGDYKCASVIWQAHRHNMDEINKKMKKAGEKLRNCKGD